MGYKWYGKIALGINVGERSIIFKMLSDLRSEGNGVQKERKSIQADGEARGIRLRGIHKRKRRKQLAVAGAM